MKSQAEKLRSEQCKRILLSIESGPKSMVELAKQTKLSLGSLEKHVAVLLVAKLISVGPDGTVSLRR